MRLYLSSFRLGNYPEELVALTGRGKRVAVILNALDNRQEARDRYRVTQVEALNALGFQAEELDLRNKKLRDGDVIVINGREMRLLAGNRHDSPPPASH